MAPRLALRVFFVKSDVRAATGPPAPAKPRAAARPPPLTEPRTACPARYGRCALIGNALRARHTASPPTRTWTTLPTLRAPHFMSMPNPEHFIVFYPQRRRPRARLLGKPSRSPPRIGSDVSRARRLPPPDDKPRKARPRSGNVRYRGSAPARSSRPLATPLLRRSWWIALARGGDGESDRGTHPARSTAAGEGGGEPGSWTAAQANCATSGCKRARSRWRAR